MCEEATGGILDFCTVYRFLDVFPGWLESIVVLDGLASWLAYALAGVFLAFLVINTVVMATALNTWFERRMLARFQARLGPNRWGPYGLLQPLADVAKLITKEDTVPDTADRPVFNIAPIAFLAPTLLVVAVIPFGENSFLGKLNVGILFIVGVTSLNTLAIFMGGWASRNKYAMLGAMRGVAMLISYEVPMALAITGVLLLGGSLALSSIVEAQQVPFLLVQPLGFLVFLAAASAEMSRTPFDQIEAESELGAGYHTEYSGMKFAIFQLAEFMAPIITALILVTLYLSGAKAVGPIPGQLMFVGKVVIVVFGMLWVRATWPRLRVDQIMGLAWKGLFGLALVNLFVVAIEVEVFRDLNGAVSTQELWVMAGINWMVTAGALVLFANILGQRKLRRPEPVSSPLANMGAEAD